MANHTEAPLSCCDTQSLNGLLTLWYQNKCWVWWNSMKLSLPVLHGSLSKWNKLDFDWLPEHWHRKSQLQTSPWILKLITQEKKLLSHFFCTTQPSSLLTPCNEPSTVITHGFVDIQQQGNLVQGEQGLH